MEDLNKQLINEINNTDTKNIIIETKEIMTRTNANYRSHEKSTKSFCND